MSSLRTFLTSLHNQECCSALHWASSSLALFMWHWNHLFIVLPLSWKLKNRTAVLCFFVSLASSRVSDIELSSTSIHVVKERMNVLEKLPMDLSLSTTCAKILKWHWLRDLPDWITKLEWFFERIIYDGTEKKEEERMTGEIKSWGEDTGKKARHWFSCSHQDAHNYKGIQRYDKIVITDQFSIIKIIPFIVLSHIHLQLC